MKNLIYILFLLLLVSCAGSAQEKNPTTNNEYEVELLFEYEGCKVYRFYDGGKYIYYTDCTGKTEWSVRSGKNNTIKMQVPNSSSR